jgi:hypothetical protein
MVMRPVQAPARSKVGSGSSEMEAVAGSGRSDWAAVGDSATAMDSAPAVEVAAVEVEELESGPEEAARQPARC